MQTYHDTTVQNAITKLRILEKELPPYCKYFFNAKANRLEPRSRYAYAIDFKVFFEFIKQVNPLYKDTPIKDIPASAIEQMNARDIDEYMAFLEKYSIDGDHRTNGESGKGRKLASIKSLCKYLVRQNIISRNPAELVESPKSHKKDILALSDNETEKLFNIVETAQGMKDHQKKIQETLRLRDYALLTLFLGTGIRVSELVGLNVKDIDFNERLAYVIRKGGDKDHVYLSEEIIDALKEYVFGNTSTVGSRLNLCRSNDEQALFISRKRKRLSVRSVQVLLKKYGAIALDGKKVTPHSLRKTYGTKLYLESNDIKLVADTLGHASIVTTHEHYVATTEEHKKNAAISIRNKHHD
ncbi:tyrosine-type recombinase/integrase [Butyrivibrio proteoclasticus]|uniref:tyrosine-type recombinase/integrase n=1 Tax=Butyrivibrio proteoclasticus TaxID=43305 RepID=UPI00054DFDE1|nr:tyrosine-type recombinase/integrase [Butyrivibrio proteoclasticus]